MCAFARNAASQRPTQAWWVILVGTSQSAPAKWPLSLSMYVQHLRGRLNGVFVFFLQHLQTPRNDLVYVNQVIIWEQWWQCCLQSGRCQYATFRWNDFRQLPGTPAFTSASLYAAPFFLFSRCRNAPTARGWRDYLTNEVDSLSAPSITGRSTTSGPDPPLTHTPLPRFLQPAVTALILKVQICLARGATTSFNV